MEPETTQAQTEELSVCLLLDEGERWIQLDRCANIIEAVRELLEVADEVGVAVSFGEHAVDDGMTSIELELEYGARFTVRTFDAMLARNDGVLSCEMGDEEVIELLKSKPRLRVLDLTGCKVTDRTLRETLGSGLLPELHTLTVGGETEEEFTVGLYGIRDAVLQCPALRRLCVRGIKLSESSPQVPASVFVQLVRERHQAGPPLHRFRLANCSETNLGPLLSELSGECPELQILAPASILMIGLDGAGKTTLLYKLKMDELITTIPTIGFNVEKIDLSTPTIEAHDMELTIWDIGGQDKIRPLWRHYFHISQAIIYVVDSADDHERFEESKDELHRVLTEDSVRGAPLLVLANKSDLPGAVSPEELTSILDVGPGSTAARGRQVSVQACCMNDESSVLKLQCFRWLAPAMARASGKAPEAELPTYGPTDLQPTRSELFLS